MQQQQEAVNNLKSLVELLESGGRIFRYFRSQPDPNHRLLYWYCL